MTFRVGQKVVCVRDDWAPLHGVIVPITGQIYTIRSIFCGVALRLHWLINPPMNFIEGFMEPAFLIFAIDGTPTFRPIIGRKTDISIFTAMLAPSEIKRKERVA